MPGVLPEKIGSRQIGLLSLPISHPISHLLRQKKRCRYRSRGLILILILIPSFSRSLTKTADLLPDWLLPRLRLRPQRQRQRQRLGLVLGQR